MELTLKFLIEKLGISGNINFEEMTNQELEYISRFCSFSEEESEKILLELKKRNLLK